MIVVSNSLKHWDSLSPPNPMATEAQIAKSLRTPKFSSRIVRRCWRCGRKHGFIRDFGLCRICFRELANRGDLPGVKKSSW